MRGCREGQRRLKGREGVSTEWSLTNIHTHRYRIKDPMSQLNSVVERKDTSTDH